MAGVWKTPIYQEWQSEFPSDSGIIYHDVFSNGKVARIGDSNEGLPPTPKGELPFLAISECSVVSDPRKSVWMSLRKSGRDKCASISIRHSRNSGLISPFHGLIF
jgi:hypothetical protein